MRINDINIDVSKHDADAFDGAGRFEDGRRDRATTDEEATIDARKIAGSTRISLGYHRKEGVRKDDNREPKKKPTSISAVGVLVGSAAFVLAGTALSTIPAAIL